MPFTDAEISKQEDYVNVLAVMREEAKYAHLEAYRKWEELKLKHVKAGYELEQMLRTS